MNESIIQKEHVDLSEERFKTELNQLPQLNRNLAGNTWIRDNKPAFWELHEQIFDDELCSQLNDESFNRLHELLRAAKNELLCKPDVLVTYKHKGR